MVRKSKIKLSIVIPLFNEELAITDLFKALNALAKSIPPQTEIILVDDGSQDSTFTQLTRHKLTYHKRLLKLSRNFGHQAALLAGLEAAKGEIVVTMDGDLQHPPSLIPEMIKYHRQGIDVVFTNRLDTAQVSFAKRHLSVFFYRVMDTLSSTRIRHNASDFRSMKRTALNALLKMPERRKFLRGMVGWIGFRTATIPFTVGNRVNGYSKYTLKKMIRLAIEGITSFSTLPLYLSAWVGFLLSVLTVIYGIYVLYVRFVVGHAVQGWSSVIIVTLVIGSVLSFLLAIIGLYLAAIYDEVKGRPIFIISEEV